MTQDQVGTTTLSACNLCRSKEITPILGYESVFLHKCEDCSFVFSTRIPSRFDINEVYNNKFNHTSYLSPITVQRYESLLDDFESFRKTNRMLDVGTGFGFFMQIARERGWEIIGVEISDLCIQECEQKGLSVLKGMLTELNLEENQFDVITGLEIIEHVSNPKEMMQEMYRLLRKDGLLYLTTPNFNAINRYRLKEKYDVISYPIHLCYFTKKTLRKLSSDVGLSVRKIQTTGYSITRVRTSKGLSNQQYVSETSDDEMLRQKMENKYLWRLGKKLTNNFLNFFKIGDSLKGHFIKS